MWVHRNLKLLFIFTAVLAMTVPLLSSCWLPHYVTDPHAKTPGYRVFTGHTDGLRISFKYPETWRRLSNEKYDTFELVSLDYGNTSIGVSSDMNSANGGDYENAHALLQHDLNRASDLPEYAMLNQSQIFLGGVAGDEISYSWRFKAKDEHSAADVDKVVIEAGLFVDYKGRIYDIGLFVDADKYESVKEGFEHIIATFRFRE